MQYEVERKFRLLDSKVLIDSIKAMGYSFARPEHHSDTYFSHPCRDFSRTDEAFRIRSIGETHFVTYKGPKIDKETKTRRELEIPLPGTPDSFGEMIRALGFQPVATVTKTRRKSKVEVNGRPFEVCLDQVDRVGSFAELETCTDESQLDAAKSDMAQLSNQLELDEDERRSYLCMLLESLEKD